MSDELRPCLRCGAKDEDNNIIGTVVEDNDGKLNYWIVCECGCAVNGYSQEEAERLWNTRPVEDELLKNIEQLRAKIVYLAKALASVPWTAIHTLHWWADGDEFAEYDDGELDIVDAWLAANAPKEAAE